MHKKIKKLLSKNSKIRYYWSCYIGQYWRYFIDRKSMKKALKEDPNKKQMQSPSKIAILFLGTNNYIKYFPKYYSRIKKFFLPKIKKDFFTFTNQTKYPPLLNKKDVIVVEIKHEKYPMLKSFEYIEKASKKLKKYDYIIWMDADFYINCLISKQEFFFHDKPLFGVRHPNFVKNRGSFEYNLKSLAGVDKEDDLSVYIQACFWGGKTDYVLKLTKELKKRIEIDFKNNIIAKIQDESHLNKYFIENKNLFQIYNPSYAYPERPIPKPFKKRIIHVYNKKLKNRG